MKFCSTKKIKYLILALAAIGYVCLSGEIPLNCDSERYCFANESSQDGPDETGWNPDGGFKKNAKPKGGGDLNDCDDTEDPVSVTGGKLFIPEVDLALSGNGAKSGITNVQFRRGFSSQTNFNGALSNNWSTTADISLQEDEAGARIRTVWGRLLNFVKKDGGTYERPECGYTTLTKINPNTYTWQLQYGTKYTFTHIAGQMPEDFYQVESITDRYGNSINFSYQIYTDSSGTTHRLMSRITDSGTNGYIQLNWTEKTVNLSPKLVIDNAQDSTGRVVHYEYEITNVAGVGEELDLAKVIDAEGYNQQYHKTWETNSLGNTYLKSFLVTNRRGNVTEYQFSLHNDYWLVVAKEIDSLGNAMEFYTDTVLSTTTFIDKCGNYSQYKYLRMLLSEEVYNGIEYGYDERRNLNYIKDRADNEWFYEYGERNNLVRELDPLGKSEFFVYSDSANRWNKHMDKRGNIWLRDIEPITGNVISESDPAGNMIIHSYDQYGNELTRKDARGNTTTFTYDNAGNLLSKTDPEGNTWEYTYNAYGDMLTETDPRDNATTYTWDKSGHMLSKLYPDNSKEEYIYDEEGNLTAFKDCRGNTTTFEYDAMNRKTAQIMPDNTRVDYVYTPMGKLKEEQRPYGTWKYEYDDQNRVVKKIDPLGNAYKFTYNGQILGGGGCSSCSSAGEDLISSITDPSGNISTIDYDPLGRKIMEKDPQNQAVDYQYDANNNLITTIDKLNKVTTYAYDKDNRLISITNPRKETIAIIYDANGNKTQVTDAKGNITRYEYDKNNRLVKIIDCLDGETIFGYDAAGNRISLTDAEGNITTYEYDNRNRLVKTTDADAKTETYAYDANNNLISKTNSRGQLITYVYDNLNRLVQKNLPNSQTITYAYDNDSRVSSITDLAGTRTFTYNAANQLVSVAYPNSRTIAYEYEANGNRSKITYPSGTMVEYTYDTRNQPLTVKVTKGADVKTFTYTYDNAGRRTKTACPNTINTNYTYDSADKISSIATGTTANPTSIDNIRYTYDVNANRTQRQDVAGTHNYTYDLLNQLTNVTYYDNTTQEYTYDGIGNRLSLHDGVTNYNSAFNDLNQLTQTTIGGATYGAYAYDLDGNTTSISRGGNNWALVWNAENRLSQVTTSQVTSYKYYDDGYLAERQQGTDVVKYINDGIHCIAKYVNGSLAEEYVYGSNVDEVLCRISGTTWHYYHQDVLQSVIAITDGSGSALAMYQYDVFGKIKNQWGAISNEILFTGRWVDATTSLYNYRARWYDPANGRFLSRDPIGIEDDVNLYRYVQNGSVNLADPEGQQVAVPPGGGFNGGINNPRGNIPEIGKGEKNEEKEKKKKWRCTVKPRGCCPEQCQSRFIGYGETLEEAKKNSKSQCYNAGCEVHNKEKYNCQCGHETCFKLP